MQPQLLLHRAAQLGEGAIWDPQRNILHWVDILDRKLFSYDPGTGVNRSIDMPSHIGTVVPRASGDEVIVALQNGFASVDLATGAVTMLAEVEAENANTRFNDGKCDPAGRFWAGTMAYKNGKGAGNLYRLDPDLSVHHMLAGVTISNGIVWTADARTMYYIDTPTQQVSAFDYDRATGGIANRRVAIDVPAELGHPDGMTIDADDTLWIAMWGGGRVCRFDPVAGKLIEAIALPGVAQVSSCAFGGGGLSTLYITTAASHYTAEQFQQFPNAGSLFAVETNARGVPAIRFAG